MVELAQRISVISESQTLAMARLTREFKSQGKDVIGLSLGEPDFNTPDFIKVAAKKAIDENYSKYTPVPGLEDIRNAIVQKLKRDNNLEYQVDQIVVSTGAKQVLFNVCHALLNPGDQVLLPAPYWVTYKEIIKLTGAQPIVIQSGIESDFKVTVEQLKQATTPKTKMLLFSSPSNPTGSMYTKEELAAFADFLEANPSITAVSDEIYEHICFERQHYSLASFSKIKDQVIIVNGVSKAFAMTGWRLGYMAASQPIAAACSKLQGQVTSATCSIAQKAAEAALLANPSEIKYMRDAFLERRNFLLNLFDQIPQVKKNTPAGAFYLFLDVSSYFGKKTPAQKTITSAHTLCMYLLEQALVSLVPGEAFDQPKCIRISYATSKPILEKAFYRIKEALEALI